MAQTAEGTEVQVGLEVVFPTYYCDDGLVTNATRSTQNDLGPVSSTPIHVYWLRLLLMSQSQGHCTERNRVN